LDGEPQQDSYGEDLYEEVFGSPVSGFGLNDSGAEPARLNTSAGEGNDA
jgi:hypothetical protein